MPVSTRSNSALVKQRVAESVGLLDHLGITVVNQSSFDRDLTSLEQNALTPEDAYRMGLAADHADAELLVISCTDYRALEAVPALEKALKKPVITSNSALMFACLQRLGLDCSGLKAGGVMFS